MPSLTIAISKVKKIIIETAIPSSWEIMWIKMSKKDNIPPMPGANSRVDSIDKFFES